MSFRRYFLLATLLLLTSSAYAQEGFTMNLGGPLRTVYADTFLVTPIRTKIILPVTIRGRQYRFMLDTGAPLMVSKELAAILRKSDLTRGVLIDESGKRDSVNAIITDTLRIGGMDYAGVPALILENKQPALACFGIDGIIGSNLLRNCAVSYDIAAGRVIISGGIPPTPGEQQVPLQLDRQSNPYIRIKVGKANGLMLFDSGDDSFLEIGNEGMQEWMKKSKSISVVREGYGATSIGFNGLQNAQKQYLILARDIRIGKQRIDSVSVESTSGETRLGARFFSLGKTVIDYAGKTFHFTPYAGVPMKNLEGKWDIVGLPSAGKLLVSTIWNKSLAGASGIQVGDEIVRIGGKAGGEITLCDLLMGTFFPGTTELEMSVRNSAGELKQIKAVKHF